MPTAKKARVYPFALHAAIREVDTSVNVRTMWEMSGPPNTSVAWLSCYLIEGVVCIVETYKDGGFELLTGSAVLDRKGVIVEALARIRRTER